MDINELTIDQDLLERINPVFNTAKMTLFQLSAAGDRDAARIPDKLGLTLESTNRVSASEEMMHNIIEPDTRFRTMGALAEETGFTEVDLPCGYTPRAIEFARKGKQFAGPDLPAAETESSAVRPAGYADRSGADYLFLKRHPVKTQSGSGCRLRGAVFVV